MTEPLKSAGALRRRYVLSRLGGDPAATYGPAKLTDFNFDAQIEFGKILEHDWYNAPERVWHGHTRERAYGLALAEGGLTCHHPHPLQQPLHRAAWVCLACDTATALVQT